MTKLAKTFGVHVELPFKGVPHSLTAPLDFDQLQLLRAIRKPILSADAYALAHVASASADKDALILAVNEKSTWEDGLLVTASDVATSIEKTLDATPGLRALLGVDEICANDDANEVRTVTRGTSALLRELLTDIRFAPSARASGKHGFTGAFVPSDDGRSYVSREKRGTTDVVLAPTVLDSAECAVRAFEEGAIAATCPAMFDLNAGSRSAEPSGPSGMVLQLIVHPRLGAWSSATFRDAIARTIEAPGEAARVLVRSSSGSRASCREVEGSKRAKGEKTPLRILYGKYWPNHLIAERTRLALVELGVDEAIELEGVSLPTLVNRVASGTYDFALTIQIETTRVTPLLTTAGSIFANAPDSLKAMLATIVRAGGDDEATIERLEDWLFQIVPTVPIFRFRTSHLTSDARLAKLDSAARCFLRLERLAEMGEEEATIHAA